VSLRYPAPPWHTAGDAVFRAYAVPAERVRPPEGFEVEARLGRSLGLLGFVDYRAPSPLVYRELLWMPARVRARADDGRVVRGFYVAKMLVDDEASLAAGREVWALPKQSARFEVGPREVVVRSEDGARVTLGLGRAGPGLPAKSAVVTVQRGRRGLVRFRGDFSGRVGPRRVAVSTAGLDGTWQGLGEASPLGPLGVALSRFEAVMRSPR
jgi:hypothetical protein